MNIDLKSTISLRLNTLAPSLLDIQDDSASHAGHKGNGGGGHFNIKIVSAQFEGKSQVARHRLIYATLNDLMPHTIHALSILAIAPSEPHQPI